MSWVLLLGLAGVVFLNRYIFLEPHLNIQLPIFLQKMLRHSAPHLMLVIASPIIFLKQGQLRESVFDPYIFAVVVCFAGLLAAKTVAEFCPSSGLFLSISDHLEVIFI
ncbi:AzlD domain-containing protein [Acinetobacter thermotolerans]|uniref:AzlD domain-containing protein n=1 Tax=Acinetobacter thermotolerans TaxID=3151487 RepID=UPI00325BCFA9